MIFILKAMSHLGSKQVRKLIFFSGSSESDMFNYFCFFSTTTTNVTFLFAFAGILFDGSWMFVKFKGHNRLKEFKCVSFYDHPSLQN